MPNQTIEKFGYPATLVRDFEHWMVLVRPAQITLGSLVLANKSQATAYGELDAREFTEQGQIVAAVERALSRFCSYERINYLMLMMVDPNVHFHVVPRYSKARQWEGIDFPDSGWPGPPDLKSAISLDQRQLSRLINAIQAHL